MVFFSSTDVADDFFEVDINEDPNGETEEANMEASSGEIKDLSDLVFAKHTGKPFISIFLCI